MKRRDLAAAGLLLAALAATACAADSTRLTTATTHGGAPLRPWHGRYYNVQYGQPLALVVPPTAELTTDYGWGVTSSRMTRIDHQFQRPWPGAYGPMQPYPFLPGAAWPSDTRQFGTYYIRGPW